MSLSERLKQFLITISEIQKDANRYNVATPAALHDVDLGKFQAALNKIIDGMPYDYPYPHMYSIAPDDLEATAAYANSANGEYFWLAILRKVEYDPELKEYFERKIREFNVVPYFEVVFM